MTDIYINKGKGGSWKWLLPLIAVVAFIAVWLWPDGDQDGPEPEAQDPQQEESSNPLPPTPTPVEEIAGELQAIQAHIESGSLKTAREQALTLLESLPEDRPNLELERLLGDLHIRMIQSKAPMEEKIFHVVRSGDTLGKLAQQHGTTIDSIAARNGIDNHVIRLGERLQILTGEFKADVSKSRNDMVVTLNGRFFKRYRVGTGTDSSTPEGDYVITLRIKHPVWYRDDGRQIPYGDPENFLGTHYLKLDIPGIGLHGTWEPESVGSQSSAGCVRLVNDDILELFNLLPEGTPVRITE